MIYKLLILIIREIYCVMFRLYDFRSLRGNGKSVSYLKFVLSFQEVRLHPQIKNIITGIFRSFGQENYIMMKRNYL